MTNKKGQLKKVVVTVGLLSTLILSACGGLSGGAGSQRIGVSDAIQMMEELDNYVILDVRTEAEYEANHIDGAMLIPVAEIKNRAEAEIPDKDVTIFVYCQSGMRSADASRTLASMGYTNVYNMGNSLGIIL